MNVNAICFLTYITDKQIFLFEIYFSLHAPSAFNVSKFDSGVNP